MKVTIRPLQEKDAYISVMWRNDPEVFKYTGNTYKNEILLETELQWIRSVIKNKNEYRCAIEVDELYVGNIYLTDIDEQSAQYHIFIGNKDYWGKGVAKSASILMLDYAFSNLRLKKVYLSVHFENKNALYLYKKLGFIEVDRKDDFIEMEILNSISIPN